VTIDTSNVKEQLFADSNLDLDVKLEEELEKYLADVLASDVDEVANLHMNLPFLFQPITFPCSIFNNEFSSVQYLCLHVRTKHKGGSPCICKQCKKTFFSSSKLENHKCIVTSKYICYLCQKEFSRVASLKKHLRVFVCEKCNKTFTAIEALRRHEQAHTGEMKFVCKICSKGFKRQSGYNDHQNIHLGNRPFVCDQCVKRFQQASNLRTHVKGIHSGEPRPTCDNCNKKFSVL